MSRVRDAIASSMCRCTGARRTLMRARAGAATCEGLSPSGARRRRRIVGCAVLTIVGCLAGRASAQVVTFQNFSEAKAPSDVTALTLSTPAGTAQGNLLIASVVTDGNNAATLSPPVGQGWTLIARNVQGTSVTLGVWWKLAGASEPSTHQWTWTAQEQAYGWMMRFTGHSPTAPINDFATTGGTASAPASLGASPTVTDTMIVRLGGFDNASITLDSPGLTTNGPHTPITMDSSSAATGVNCSGGAGYKTQAAAGNSGLSSFALTATQTYRTVTIAIAPFRCVSAGECDDGNVCTTDTCVSGFCQHANNTATCSDGNNCTLNDACSGGSCVPGAPPNCSGSGNQCNTASCNPAGPLGNCNTLTPVTNGTPCNDGAFCTDGDACFSGSCQPGGARDCSSAANQCNVGVCNETSDLCVPQPANQGQSCSDGNNCTLGETCNSGVCTGGTPPNCTAADTQCTAASCNPSGPVGNCNTSTPRANGTTCNDGAFCTATDACQSGSCVGSGDRCPGELCDEFLDLCVECFTLADCDDGVACTVEGCQSGTCLHVPNNALCSDGLFCNGAETCQATLGCQAGTPPCADSIACTVDACVESTDTCTYTPNDALCSDGQFCNGSETCSATLGCQGGADPCVDGVPCTVDSCTESTDTCVYTTNDALCDDGSYCNGSEFCHAILGCQPGSDPCIDGVPCTDDSCAEATDTCVFTPNDAACDDGVFCNGAETCDPVLDCLAGTDPCDDGFTCTADACSEGTDSCTNTPNDAACDDGLYCNGAETCSPSLGCVAGAPPCLVTQVCVEPTDTCQACLVPADCDDGDPCTAEDCVAGECFYSQLGQITVDLEVEGLGDPVTRDVRFDIVACGGTTETRTVGVSFSAAGVGSTILSGVDADSDWIAVREGHTLRGRRPLSFTTCSASVAYLGANRLRSGDFAAGAVVQDNLVDVTDFSILASRWNQVIDPNLATGADATGDGLQGTADFTAVQTNFLASGDAVDGCTLALTTIGTRRRAHEPEAQLVESRRLRVAVGALRFPNADRADVNGDGFVDGRDIRAFAKRHRLPLTPAFDRLLEDAERRGPKGR